MKITVKLLKSKGACAEQVDKFAALFPDGVEPTKALCFAHAQTFDWRWAAENLLPAPAREAYDKARAPAERAYNEARATAEKAYNEAVATAWKARNEALAPAERAYNEAVATAFGRVVENS